MSYLALKDQDATRYLIAGRRVVTLYRLGDLWVDEAGTVFALQDDKAIVDHVTRCGIGPISLPEGDPLNDACRAHDYAYSSPAYQTFHTREEADAELERQLGLVAKGWRRILVRPFAWIVRRVGGMFWEANKTR